MVMLASHAHGLEAFVVDERLLSGLGELRRRGKKAQSSDEKRELRKKTKDFMVSTATPKIAALVAKDIDSNPHAKRAVIETYLTASDPMAEYREVAAFDFMTVLGEQYPEDFLGSEAVGVSGFYGFDDLGKSKAMKRIQKSFKKVAKPLAIAAAVVGAVALAVTVGPAVVGVISKVGGALVGAKNQQAAAKAETKAVNAQNAQIEAQNAADQAAAQQAAADQAAAVQAMEQAAASAYPPVGQMASTTQTANQAVANQYERFDPVKAGAVDATNQMIGNVAPQAMASYAANQVAGKTPAQLSAQYGIPQDKIQQGRIDQAANVAQGNPVSSPFPVLPVAAAAGGGLILALATGII